MLKRASELRDILGLAKCSNLLSRVVEEQSQIEINGVSMERARSQSSERTPSSLRPQAAPWTPSSVTDSPKNGPNPAPERSLPAAALFRSPQSGALLSPFPDLSAGKPAQIVPGTFYIPPTAAKLDSLDMSMDGKQFISSLAAKHGSDPHASQTPIAPPSKDSQPPPSLAPLPSQQLHSFPLAVSLLPHTFSVQLLSTLHMQMQHVASALEMLDTYFSTEIAKTTLTQMPSSTRWETWMSPSGAAGMTRALQDVRKGLDELCGATARAGWIVDTWRAFQNGKLDGTTTNPELNMGSAAIDGVELGVEKVGRGGVQPPIGRPVGDKTQKSSNGVAMKSGAAQPVEAISKAANVFPQAPSTGSSTFRPPPGLTFLLNSGSIPEANCLNTSKSGSDKGIQSTLISPVGLPMRNIDLMKAEIAAPRFPRQEQLEMLQRHFANTNVAQAKKF